MNFLYKNKKLKSLLIFLVFSSFSFTFSQCSKNDSKTVSTGAITETSTNETASSDSSETTEENQEFLNILEDIKKEFGENIVSAKTYLNNNNFKLAFYFLEEKPHTSEITAVQGSINSDFLFLYSAHFSCSYNINNLSIDYTANTENSKNDAKKAVQNLKEKLNTVGITPSENGTELKWESGQKYISIDDYGKNTGEGYKLAFSFLSDEEKENEKEKDPPEDLTETAEKNYKEFLAENASHETPFISKEDSIMCHEFNNVLNTYRNISYDELKNKLSSENINFTENNKEISYTVNNIYNIHGLDITYKFRLENNTVAKAEISFSCADRNLTGYFSEEFDTFKHNLSTAYGNPVSGEGFYYFLESSIVTNSQYIGISLSNNALYNKN